MQLYVIRRRSGWTTSAELQFSAAKSARVGDTEMPDQVRWIRTYVVEESDGKLGTFCIYEAAGPDSIREHARRAGIPADDIRPVIDTLVVRPDPPKT